MYDDLSEPEVGRPERSRPPVDGAAAHMLALAMLAVGEILEPEKTDVVIEQTNDQPHNDDLPFDLKFPDELDGLL